MVSNTPCKVQVGLARHGDVGQVLLEDEDVSTHFLDTRFADALEVLGAIDENTGNQVAQAWEGR